MAFAASIQQMPSRDVLLSVEDVAQRLNVTKDWVWDHSSRKAPYLPVIRMSDGGRYAVDVVTLKIPILGTILGKGTTASERPQGPTCVYTNAGRTVTLAVEVNSVKQLRKEARKSTKVDLGGKTGYCVKYQTTAVITGISEGRVLRADGPCQAGVRFVTKALRRL